LPLPLTQSYAAQEFISADDESGRPTVAVPIFAMTVPV
jgi:hypothetical protein